MAQPIHEKLSWYTIHDTVMGGKSEGTIASTKNEIVFRGNLSLENNGGFASVRSSQPPVEINRAMGIRLQIRGDGRTYLATLRLQDTDPRVYFRKTFETEADEYITVDLPFSHYRPFAYGRSVPQIPCILCADTTLNSIGFMLADKQAGSFMIEIVSIELYGVRTQPPRLSNRDKDLLKEAVMTGVPLYNRGDIKGCAETYKAVLEKIQKRTQDEWIALLLEDRPQQSNEQAWWLRHIINRLLEV